MKYNTIKFIIVFVIGAILLTGCEKDNTVSIVGEWQWTGTIYHNFSYWGEDTTLYREYPLYKDLTFDEKGKAEVMIKDGDSNEEEPPYYSYQYNYSIRASKNTIIMKDPLGQRYSLEWQIKTLTKETLIVEYSSDRYNSHGPCMYWYTWTAIYLRK